MKIVAKSIEGQEFLYSASSAHSVSKASANAICKALNNARYDLKEGQVWFVHDIGQYDNAYIYALSQKFYRNRGKIMRSGY